MSEPLFGRVIPAMITPYDEDKKVDHNKAKQLVVRLIDGGSDAVLISGTTGEGPTVSYEDKMQLFRDAVEAAAGRVPIIANVGSNDTKGSIAFARDAATTGVDALMAVVPYYNKPPQAGLYEHFKAIAAAVDLPIILYNIPGRCGVNMEAQTTIKLARDIDNIVAVKEASGNLDQIKEIIDNTGDDFFVYSGDDSLTYDIMKLGGVGVITTAGNVAPDRMKEITDACAAGDFEKAREAHERFLPLMKGLFATANPILVKEALNLMGFYVGGVRLPLVDATPEQSKVLAEIMREVGVL
ncbi:MAG: 4-hydroxy-tetrahydrodipicolinate synthase [Eggerthellaceae bacterium]|jgi:4-hydroxy-tetrahydrodipicolinate synthase